MPYLGRFVMQPDPRTAAIAKARNTALRTAQQVLIDLAAWIESVTDMRKAGA